MNMSGSFKLSGNRQPDKSKITDQLDNELNIPQELKYIIEDEDDDMPLMFTDPSELMEIFQ